MPRLEEYIEPIKIALWVFPILAFVFTFPFVYVQYRKFKSIPWIKALVIYSFIYYLLAVYFLVILPLPDRSTVIAGRYWETMTLIPFIHFYEYYLKHGITWRFLISFDLFQLLYNVVMLVPFGVYMRYYFKASLKKTILIALGFSLFLELTQLSGLYFIYPGPYRCFDVNDLICNTLGGIFGWLIGKKILFFLPSREKLDEMSLSGRVSGLQLIWALGIDFVVFMFPFVIVMLVISIVIPSLIDIVEFDGFFGCCFLIYQMIFAILKDGSSIGKNFVNVRVACVDESLDKKACYIKRYGILIIELTGCKLLSYLIETYFSQSAILSPIWFLADIIPVIFVLRYLWHIVSNKRDMFYERLSHTSLVSKL